jgi:DNA-binding FrmR family transcriptional regulator
MVKSQAVGEGKTLDAEKERDLLLRLRRIEGQIRGIQKMIEERRDCHEIIGQLLASRAALDKVGLQLLNQELKYCFSEVYTSNPEKAKIIEETLKSLIRFT